MADFHSSFGTAVRDARHQAGISQEALASRAGVHRTYISSIELGKVRIGLEIAQRLALALNITLSELIAAAERLESNSEE